MFFYSGKVCHVYHHRVVSRASLALGAGCDYRETARLVADCAGLAARGLGIDPDRCASVGVGCPGIANRETGEVVYSGPMVWNHVPLGKELQKHFPAADTVAVAELAGCTALGEALAGAALRCAQVVLFQFGAGIGSGVVIDGRIFGGKYCAGAVSYTHLMWTGPGNSAALWKSPSRCCGTSTWWCC